ncbi:MAG: restriction endonuclease PLD domain-containing protein [Caldimicrobium sp.]
MLFKEELLKGISKPILKVTKGVFFTGSPEEILKDFNKIKAITFSTSVKSVLDLLKNYSEIELLIGIEEQGIQIYQLSEFLDSLRKDIEGCLLNQKVLSVYYVSNCHSKLYLLYGDKGKIAIIGSGNLSLSAWKGEQEEIFVLVEDESVVAELENYYLALKEKAKEVFLSEKVKKLITKKATELGFKVEFFVSKPEIVQEWIKKNEVKEVVFHSYVKNLATLPALENLDKARMEKRKAENSFAMLEKIKESKKEVLSLQNPQKINSLLKEINTEKNRTPDVEVGEKEIFYKGESINQLSIEDENLKKTVQALKEYIKSAEETSVEYPLLIGEAITFAFYSVFLNKIRKKALKEGVDLNYFPVFALLVGEAGAGKTMLLRFISKLLGINLWHYKKIEKFRNTPAYTIESYAYDGENLPLLIDEVTPSHFKDTSSLGEVLKAISEDAETKRGFIFTSNLREFRGERQIMRRACFLPFKVQISSRKNVGLLLSEIDTSLFLKFLKFMQGKELEIKEDPLYFSREFLINEGVPVPERYYGNFERAMLERWRELYLTSSEKFEEVKALHRKEKDKIVDCFRIRSDEVGFVTPLEIFDNGYMSGYYILLKEEFLKALRMQEKLPLWKRILRLS